MRVARPEGGGDGEGHESEECLGLTDRMFEEFESRFERSLAKLPSPGAAAIKRMPPELPETGQRYPDLVDLGREYRVVAEVLMIPKDRLDIAVTESDLRIRGDSKTYTYAEEEGFVRQERSYSRISRRVIFPEPVLPEGARASLANGVLEVRVPKRGAFTSTGGAPPETSLGRQPPPWPDCHL